MSLGMLDLLLLGIALALAIAPLLGVIDAARMDRESWHSAGHGKMNWLALLLGGTLCFGAGLIPAGIYFLKIRPKVAAFERDPNRPTRNPL